MDVPDWLKRHWILALVTAFALELAINVFAGRTIWHRLTALEHSVEQLQHERELEDLEKR